jgi:hypothetical protein
MHGKAERKLSRHRTGQFLVVLSICFAFVTEAADQPALIDGMRSLRNDKEASWRFM